MKWYSNVLLFQEIPLLNKMCIQTQAKKQRKNISLSIMYRMLIWTGSNVTKKIGLMCVSLERILTCVCTVHKVIIIFSFVFISLFYWDLFLLCHNMSEICFVVRCLFSNNNNNKSFGHWNCTFYMWWLLCVCIDLLGPLHTCVNYLLFKSRVICM